jgi:site-specific recombinase XerD
MLLRDALHEWLGYHMEIRRYTRGTLKDMKCSVNRLLLYLEEETVRGAREIGELATADILAWIEHIKKKGIAHTTVLKNVSHLSSFLDYLQCRELIPANPASAIKLKKTASKMTNDFLSQEQVAILFQVVRDCGGKAGFRDYCIFALLYGSGLRAGELCALRMDDVSVGKETIFVNHGKRGRQRYVPIPENLLPILKEYKALRGTKGRAFFQMKGERPVTLKYLRDLLKKLARAAHIDQKVTPKTLRHSYATHLAEEGVKIPVVAKLMGHKTIRESNPYLHVSLKRLKQAIDDHPAVEILSGLEVQP